MVEEYSGDASWSPATIGERGRREASFKLTHHDIATSWMHLRLSSSWKRGFARNSLSRRCSPGGRVAATDRSSSLT